MGCFSVAMKVMLMIEYFYPQRFFSHLIYTLKSDNIFVSTCFSIKMKAEILCSKRISETNNVSLFFLVRNFDLVDIFVSIHSVIDCLISFYSMWIHQDLFHTTSILYVHIYILFVLVFFGVFFFFWWGYFYFLFYGLVWVFFRVVIVHTVLSNKNNFQTGYDFCRDVLAFKELTL